MKLNSVKSIIIMGILFIFMVSSPAFAGRVTVHNLHKTKSYVVFCDLWLFGFKSNQGIIAAPQSSKSHDDFFKSIGVIDVTELQNSSSTISLKTYTPSGAYLPHRGFTATIDAEGNIDISEK